MGNGKKGDSSDTTKVAEGEVSQGQSWGEEGAHQVG